MAWDEFVDRVKEGSVDVMEKAKDTTKRFATIHDLKSEIRGYSNDKNKLFTQMGMDLYLSKKKGQNIDEAIDAFVAQIDVLNTRIQNLKEKLALIESETKSEKGI